MPVKLRRLKLRDHRITPEAMEAWRAGDQLALHAALGLRPWQASPIEAHTPQPPAWSTPGPWHDSWALARELRAELKG